MEKKKRVNIYIGEEMHDYLREQSMKMGLTMSGLTILAIYNFRQQDTVVPQMESVLRELEKKQD